MDVAKSTLSIDASPVLVDVCCCCASLSCNAACSIAIRRSFIIFGLYKDSKTNINIIVKGMNGE